MKQLSEYIIESIKDDIMSRVADLEEQFELKSPDTFEEFISNIDEILRSYSDRKMASLQVYDYIQGYPQYHEKLLKHVGGIEYSACVRWCNKRQTKLRSGVSMKHRNAIAQANVAAILRLAGER